jgi:hypothetical protein
VSNMISHFRFDDSLAIDKHLRWLYWSFEGGSEDRADWRDIFSCLKVLLLARCVGGSDSHSHSGSGSHAGSGSSVWDRVVEWCSGSDRQ